MFGRFEASRCNEIWTGDALHGPVITGRKTYLFAFLDDRSRAVMAARFSFSEDTVRLAAALRPALASRGVPDRSTWTTGRRSWTPGCCEHARAWASSSCTPRPAVPRGGGRSSGSSGVRDQFLVEITEQAASAITGLAEMNRLFTAWTETVYHPRAHSETGRAAAPLAGRRPGAAAAADPAQLAEAFM